MWNDIAKSILLLSASGSLIALFLVMLKSFVQVKFSEKWYYYIWLIVLIRFVLPIGLPVSISHDMIIQREKPSSVIVNEKPSISAPTEILTNNNNYEAPQQNPLVIPEKQDTEIGKQTATVPTKSILDILLLLSSYMGLIWLIVCLILIAKKVFCYHQYVRLVKKNSRLISDQEILRIYDDICDLSGMKRRIPLLTTPGVTSPMLIGLMKPMIILPEKQIENTSQLKYIFMHELTHFIRLDIYYKWFVQIVLSIHWFNPIIYFISREINKACELSCDEAVIKKLTFQEKRAYGDTLIHSLELGCTYHNPSVSLTLVENAKFMKERLGAIMKYKTKSKMVTCLSIFFAFILSTGAMFTVAYADTAGHEAKTANHEDTNNASPVTASDLENIVPIPNTSVGARGLSGKWAKSTGIEADTYQKQLAEKLKWIQELYKEKKQKFQLYETISEKEITNTLGINYMYANSDVYRDMANVGDDFKILPFDSSFYSSVDKKFYERRVFYVDKPSTMNLSISYDLNEGKLALYIVSPEGKIAFQSSPSDKYNDNIALSLSKGLWSVVTKYETKSDAIKGTQKIEAKIISSEENNGNNDLIVNIPETNGKLYVKTYGKYNLKKNEIIKADLNWDGNGPVMFLYTKEKYSVENIDKLVNKGHLPLKVLGVFNNTEDKEQDIVPSLSANYTYKQMNKDIKLNFTTTPNKPINWTNKIPETGAYYIYIIAEGDRGIKNVKGKITFLKDEKDGRKLGDSKEEKENDGNKLEDTKEEDKKYDKKIEDAKEEDKKDDKEIEDTKEEKENDGNKLGHFNEWNGTCEEKTNATGLLLELKDFTGDKINTSFYPDENGNKTLEFTSSLIGDFKIAFITSDRTIIKTIPSFTGYKEITLNDLPEDRIDMIILSRKVSGTLKVNTVSEQAGDKKDMENVVIDLKYNDSKIISGSGHFKAEDGQTLLLNIKSDLDGGSVDMFLFDPSGKENRITISSDMSKEIKLSKGEWAYNCFGMQKDGGSLQINGTIK
jgi:Antirepressor regulating drug resistance, predicted signal transduction N-terminal membrane component